ncbi:uncharacterized protein CCR75_006629 [Bremia lactucae]|uniref:Uncharacterized protein n=1 Tax=Bremia lactucae TaxID=4779 RepID=A0A976FDZ3_BRELC|nr:hypothetical protein CCR75_006629 [Bremia lactucae]
MPSASPLLNELFPPPNLSAMTTASISADMHSVSMMSSTDVMETVSPYDEHLGVARGKYLMNALWTFEGHRLCKLQTATKMSQKKTQRHELENDSNHSSGSLTEAIIPSKNKVDTNGQVVMYGSCGRDKRYARCSVCYFRGLRCNTAHYCACCLKAVCIRPRVYPGEEHSKICWNVLHMDNEIINRVMKTKKRKLNSDAGVAKGLEASGSATHLRSLETEDSGYRHQKSNQGTLCMLEKPLASSFEADENGAVNL